VGELQKKRALTTNCGLDCACSIAATQVSVEKPPIRMDKTELRTEFEICDEQQIENTAVICWNCTSFHFFR